MIRIALLSVMAAMLLTSCATAPVLPPAVTPEGEDRFLIHPATGYSAASEESDRRLEAAWRHFLAGEYEQARRRLNEIRTRDTGYAPAALLNAAIDLREGRLPAARDAINTIADQHPGYTAARVYQAEVALAEGNTRRAWEIYRSLSGQAGALPVFAERLVMVERRLFEELFTAARAAEDAASIPLLREALTINPGAVEARLLLVRRLIGRKQFDEARRIMAPLVSSPDGERDEVQELLAEIDVGRGRYQEAIGRYEKLVRRSPEPRLTQRLEEIKEEWTLANMPTHYRAALESEAITRAGLAVLIYWKLTSVRFAQNLPSPPIATDIADVQGRDEIIRAIAIGLYDVDPVTRRVSPFRTVTAGALARHAARLLVLRGATCARGLSGEAVLAACGISDPAATLGADSPVPGRTAARVIEEIERALER